MKNKKTDFASKAADLLAKGIKFAKDGNVVAKQTAFSIAYAKLARTAETCTSWIKQLTELGADPAVILPFEVKLLELTEVPAIVEPVVA